MMLSLVWGGFVVDGIVVDVDVVFFVDLYDTFIISVVSF